MRIPTLVSIVPSVAVIIAAALTSSAANAQGVRIKLAAWNESVLLDTLRQNHELQADPRKVYEAVLTAYADLGIPTGRTDGRAGIIGSERFERMRTLADAPMSRYFDCGGEGNSGPHANEYRLEIAVATWVEPAPQGAKIGVATIASARDISGVYRNPTPCASSGVLEKKVAERVATILKVPLD